MLLKDFRSDSQTKINVINKFLSENFGMTINGGDYDRMVVAKETLSESIHEMKRQNTSLTSDKYSKALLSYQVIDSLLESHQERPHRTYRVVLDGLYNTAVGLIEIGDDLDEAVRTVMREYRSSRYRFPDEEVEGNLRNRLMNYVASMQNELAECSLSEGDGDQPELWCCDDCTIGIVNNDFTAIDDEERYEEVLAAVNKLAPKVAYDGEQNDEYDRFSRRPCDCCGTNLAGSRHKFILMRG